MSIRENSTGNAPAKEKTSNSRRYDIFFVDGKKATALNMTDSDPSEVKRGITGIFHKGYVAKITQG